MGNTFCSNAAQCGQVREENSTIVTGALAGPIAMSGRDTGCAANAASALCAIARSIDAAHDKAESRPRATTATKIRRMTVNGALQFGLRYAVNISRSWLETHSLTMSRVTPKKKPAAF